MANTFALVKQAELTRYLKATVAAGVSVGRVVIGRDGSVTIYPTSDDDKAGDNKNDWD